MSLVLNHFLRAERAKSITNIEKAAEEIIEPICRDIKTAAESGKFYLEPEITINKKFAAYIRNWFQTMRFYVYIISKEDLENDQCKIKYHIDWY